MRHSVTPVKYRAAHTKHTLRKRHEQPQKSRFRTVHSTVHHQEVRLPPTAPHNNTVETCRNHLCFELLVPFSYSTFRVHYQVRLQSSSLRTFAASVSYSFSPRVQHVASLLNAKTRQATIVLRGVWTFYYRSQEFTLRLLVSTTMADDASLSPTTGRTTTETIEAAIVNHQRAGTHQASAGIDLPPPPPNLATIAAQLLQELHYSADWAQVRQLVQECPMVIQEKDYWGRLPLHHACHNRNITLNVIKWLVEQWPDAIKEKDNSGWLSLHFSCNNQNLPLNIIQWLVEQWPEAIKEKNHGGQLPLHLASQADAKLDVIQWLVEQWPEAIQEKDNAGWLPLHLASQSDAKLDVIQWLVEQWPEAIKD